MTLARRASTAATVALTVGLMACGGGGQSDAERLGIPCGTNGAPNETEAQCRAWEDAVSRCDGDESVNKDSLLACAVAEYREPE